MFMMGAMFTWMGLTYFDISYWNMLWLAPLLVALFGMVIEKTMLQWLYKLDHLYGLLLTFGITLMIEGVFRSIYGSSGRLIRCPRCCKAQPISTSWFCPTTGRGWWSLLWWCVLPHGL
jgi:branched-chain amino acid transport system permease protein